MAVPKRKVSKARRNSRRANWKLTAPNLGKCSKCGALVMSHRVCKACGTYKNKVVIVTE
ncbi:MAG: 50S ribosomal protein L32 [Firmicutes bacterium HGW-Firmicutes-7]|jgi:large subunit ribosomal protein L32|nr:MAG: 50S ribosomal protein L32 [Firmicutes bacterium HGW-Firmicutes-7]PKM96148.1 MAG: 50S ribosomal protein L32 [Firmicutes bacterium HGW-Firmicutes-1]